MVSASALQVMEKGMDDDTKTGIIFILIILLLVSFNFNLKLLEYQSNISQPNISYSPQKHLRIGDKIQTTGEYWKWYGDTTSFNGWVLDIDETGNVTVKLNQGTCRCDPNSYTLNEYWVEKTDFVTEPRYTDYKNWNWR